MSYEEVQVGPNSDEEYPQFKSSQLDQHVKLRLYLDMKICDPYNHFCINCKRRKSTHFLLWIGAFTCDHCASAIQVACGGNKFCYVKDVFGDQWDDY